LNSVSTYLARQLWWWMLWLMRRPWMKRLQRASMRWAGSDRESRLRQSLIRQNAFARHVGLWVLTFSINLLLGSIVVIGAFAAAIELRDSGLLTYPVRAGR
jgi:hypothetical protein